MAVDSKAANLLLMSEMSEEVEQSDPDDCESEDEDAVAVVNRGFSKAERKILGSLEKEDAGIGDYCKMSEIESREYQNELLKLAIEGNIIICLPTGSGKTYIALKLTEHMLSHAIAKKQKIIFLANTVPLVYQQANYFSANLVSTAIKDDSVVRSISGDLNVDIWNNEQWDEVMEKYHILVMSTQILLDAITKAYVKWSQLALIILDECHHAQKNHPMALLMKNYGERRAVHGMAQLPKVLGLTATIIKGQSNELQIEKDISDIEVLLCCKAVTHRNYEEVLKYSTENNMQPIIFKPKYSTKEATCTEINELIQLLDQLPKDFVTEEEVSLIEKVNHPALISEDQIYNKNKGVPATLKSFLNDLLKTYEELGPYGCKMAAIHKFVFLTQWIQQLDEGTSLDNTDDDDEMEEAKMGSVILLYNAQTVVIQFMKKLDHKMAEEAAANNCDATEKNFVRYCISDKVKVLWNILKDKRPSTDDVDNELCGLVFCQRRITALCLRWYLQKASELWSDDLGFIKPELMVGHSTIVQNTEAARITARKQTDIIRRFHAKELNLLVATQVVEEGLNVPSCNLVVRFDSIQTYPSFVQSMGRARKKAAICYALIDESIKEKEQAKLEGYRRYNQRLSAALEKNAIHVGGGNDEVIVGVYDTPIPPFCPRKDDPDGPIITATDSISLVHRYCNSLNCDKIGALFPTAFWDGKQEDKGRSSFKGYVMLPISSPIREVVEGIWMPDKTLAKRSAYLEVAKKLYYADELTDNLLPKPRSIRNFKCAFLEDLAERHKKEKSTTDAKIGSRKRVQLYKKAIPKDLLDSQIKSGTPVSVYRIEITLNSNEYSRGEESKKLFDFERNFLSYGIVTAARLHNIPPFQLLANYGTYTVSINKCEIGGKTEVTLSEVEIASLESFQVFLLDSVYNVKNPALVTDTRRPILIAPLCRHTVGNFEIEWDVVSSATLSLVDEGLNPLNRPDEELRKKFQFQRHLYENTVLVPWYKDDKEPEFLCALNVLDGQDGTNSLSVFDEPKKFPTFKDYFQKKYNVEIYAPSAPLIEVKSIGSQLNFLTKKTDGKALRKYIQRSLLKMVPELVNVFNLPASLYIQGRLLPSILHRLYRLIIADEFRQAVAVNFEWAIDVPMEDKCNDINKEKMETDEFESDEPEIENVMKSISLEISGSGTPTAKKKEELLFLDEINPLQISWDTITRSSNAAVSRKRKGQGRDTKFALPEPPVLKSNFGYELISFDNINFTSFDKPTDFEEERGPKMETIMEAMTLSNAHDCVSLEKLEVMGDSVLKLLVSLHIFRSFPQWDEGKMTLLRMQLISNCHLYQIGKSHNIGELLSGSIFIPNTSWTPCGFAVPKHIEDWAISKDVDYALLKSTNLESLDVDDLNNIFDEASSSQKISPHTTLSHSKIGDKSIADAVEAIIGAYFMNGGIDGALRIMQFLGLKGPLEDGSAIEYSRTSTLSPPSKDAHFKKSGDPSRFVPLLKDLEEILNYEFKDKWLAVEALTHPTFMGNRSTPCYERLEYVGDAILDFLVTNYILKNTKITDPGEITDLRAALVNNVTFASLAVRYGFHSFLKYESEMLASFIAQFAAYQKDNNFVVGDPFTLLSDFDCTTVREIEVPKVLGDVFESIAGAIFVDSGMSIDVVWKVFYRLMKNELELFSKKIPKNPLRELYEKFPTKVKFSKLSSDTITNPKSKAQFGSKFQAVFLRVPCCESRILGVGNTIKQAKQAAAKFVVRGIKSKELTA